jgi:hypothetical protein
MAHIKKAKIIKLTKEPSNLYAFLNSCEDHLRGEPGVFEFFLKNKTPEKPEASLVRILKLREKESAAIAAGKLTRAQEAASSTSFASDPLMASFYQQELTRANKFYDDFCRACYTFLGELSNGHCVDREIWNHLQSNSNWKIWNEAYPPNLYEICRTLATVQETQYLFGSGATRC